MKEIKPIKASLPAVREAIRSKTMTTCATKRYESYSAFAPIVRQTAQSNQTPEILRAKYGDLDRFLAMVSPQAQPAFARRPEVAVRGEYPTLQEISECYGRDFDVEWLTVQICDMSTFTGAKNMDENQQEVLARTIAAEYPGLKVTELLLFFHRFKTGRYGRFYGNVDPMVVTTALHDFVSERNDLRDAVIDTEADEWQQQASKKAEEFLSAIHSQLKLTSEQLYIGEINGYQRKIRISTSYCDVFDALNNINTAQQITAIARKYFDDTAHLVLWLNIGCGRGVSLNSI